MKNAHRRETRDGSESQIISRSMRLICYVIANYDGLLIDSLGDTSGSSSLFQVSSCLFFMLVLLYNALL
jgi:hypothetical protein